MRKSIYQISKSNSLRAGLRWLFLATIFLTMPAVASIYTFSTSPNVKDTTLEPVSAEAIFDISAGSMNVTLINFQSNITSIGQDISSLFFTVNNGSSILSLAGANVTLSGPLVDVSTGGVATSAGTLTDVHLATRGTSTEHWSAGQGTRAGRAGQSYFNDLNGGSKNGVVAQTIIGPADSNGNYMTVNGSIYGNGPHNPFVQKQATFKIADAGLLSTSTLSAVTIGFGTGTDYLPTGKVPEPGSLALIAIGGAALARILRRRPLLAMNPIGSHIVYA